MNESANQKLYTVKELADFCDRSYEYMRELFAAELLPEPKHRVKHKRRTTRRFTMQECNVIKQIVQSKEYRKWRTRRQNVKMRKIMKGDV